MLLEWSSFSCRHLNFTKRNLGESGNNFPVDCLPRWSEKVRSTRVLIIFLKPSRFQCFWRPTVFSACLPFIFHLSDVWHGWPTSHLKRCLGSPPFTALDIPLQFPWLVPSLWLDLFMLKYLREVWAVFSFLIYLISGWAHPSPQSQGLCIRWWFPISCL